MSITKEIFKKIIPQKIVNSLRVRSYQKKLRKIKSFGAIDKHSFQTLLSEILELKHGDNIFVHSSLDFLNIDFSPNLAIKMIRDTIGQDGTLVMPTFSGSSYEFLKSSTCFNINRTPSQSGLLSELLRRNTKSTRSLHPTKSVVALGPLSEFLTNNHHKSLYPFSPDSPFYKLISKDFIVIGLGVSTSKLSIVHCAEDLLEDKFPVAVNHKQIFNAQCIDQEGVEVVVTTFAHNMFKMNHNIPRYIKKHFDESTDSKYLGRDIFRLSSKLLHEKLIDTALKGITIYPRYSYKFRRLLG